MKKINQTELNILIQNHNLYLDTLTEENKKGQRLILDEVDFTDNDLAELNFVETYITSSLFKGKIFDNINFGGAELYECIFKDVVFKNSNFGKTTFDYAKVKSSEFIKCDLTDLGTFESQFEEVLFENCVINSAFSNCIVKNIEFEKCIFVSTEFWQCVIDGLKFSSKEKKIDLKFIKEINKGTIENPTLINGQEAIDYFRSKCI